VALGFLGWHAVHHQDDAPRGLTLYAEALRLARDTGQDHLVAGIISDIAEPAVRLGHARDAARLAAAAGAMRGRRPGLRGIGTPEMVTGRRLTRAAAREAMAEEDFAAAWAEGQAMAEEQAIASALALAVALAAPGTSSADASAPAPPGRLTAREVEVLKLLAEGASNQAIADQLVLSIKTVERHIANIYAKIGAHGRVEAAAFAQRHHLLAHRSLRST
jgi:DNA-binding CsgD family transcriptional regulator